MAGQQVQHRNPGYLELFDALLAQETYSLSQLKSELSGKSWFRHPGPAMAHLQELLLGALRGHRASRDPAHRLRQELTNVDLLVAKGLYPAAMKRARKALNNALEAGDLATALGLLDRQARMVHGQKERKAPAQIEAISQQRSELLLRLKEIVLSQNLRDRAFAEQRAARGKTNRPASTSLENELDAYLEQPTPVAQLACLNRLNIQASRFLNQKNYPAALQARREMVDLFRSQPKLAAHHPYAFKIALSNYLTLAALNQKFDEFDQLLPEIESRTTGSPREEAEVFQNVAFLRLLHFLNSGRFPEGLHYLPVVETGLKRHRPHLNKARELAIRYNSAMVLFLLGKYQECLKWLNDILQDEGSDHRKDIQRTSKVLHLLVHFELGNMDLVEYLHRNARRSLQKQSASADFELMLLDHLQAIYRASYQAHPRTELETLLDDLERFKGHPDRSHTPALEEVRLWTKGKLEQKTPGEVLLSEV